MHPVDARNLLFYETVAAKFDKTRKHPWRGWNQLEFPHGQPLKILDVGCGNARLYPFIVQRHPAPVHYVGVDFSPQLLDRAAANLKSQQRDEDTVELHQSDVHALPTELSDYDRIFVFGVFHHIAIPARRAALIKTLETKLKVSGQLWCTLWQFAKDPRFDTHQMPPPPDAIDPETGAVWLNFDGKGHRYCVDVDPNELSAAAKACGLTEAQRFFADGKTNRLNLYLGFNKNLASSPDLIQG